MLSFLTLVTCSVLALPLLGATSPDTTETASATEPEPSYYVDTVSWHIRNAEDGSDENIALLTIDDGPRSNTTPDLLELLDAHDVPALFFIVGEPAAAHPELIDAILERGHAIGNHTWSHANLAELPPDSVRREIERLNNWLTHHADYSPTFFRPPYGVSSPTVDSVVEEESMRSMGWSAESYDWMFEDESETVEADAEEVARLALQSLQDGNILLIHDRPVAVEALEIILSELADEGLEFVLPDALRQGPR